MCAKNKLKFNIKKLSTSANFIMALNFIDSFMNTTSAHSESLLIKSQTFVFCPLVKWLLSAVKLLVVLSQYFLLPMIFNMFL